MWKDDRVLRRLSSEAAALVLARGDFQKLFRRTAVAEEDGRLVGEGELGSWGIDWVAAEEEEASGMEWVLQASQLRTD